MHSAKGKRIVKFDTPDYNDLPSNPFSRNSPANDFRMACIAMGLSIFDAVCGTPHENGVDLGGRYQNGLRNLSLRTKLSVGAGGKSIAGIT